MFFYKRLFIVFIGIFLLLVGLSSCNEQQRKGFEIKNTAIGKAGSVLVVMEDIYWDGMLGQAVQDGLEDLYLVLPQAEPKFDLKQTNAENFKGFYKDWRVVIIFGALPDKSIGARDIKQLIGPKRVQQAMEDPSFNSIMIEDLWAKGQKVYIFFAQNQAELIEAFKAKEQAITAEVEELDAVQLNANNYQSGKNSLLNKKIKDDFGFNLELPANYEQAIYDSLAKAMWVRKETGSTSNNILIRALTYTSQEQLSRENLIAIRDTLGKSLITTAEEGAYMVSDKDNLEILYKELQIDGHFAINARGLWKMEKDYMGGPFTSYLIHDEASGKLIFLDGFIHAPGKEKRSLAQQIDLILRGATFD